MIARLRRVRREFLGINRRNQQYLFVVNPARRWALVDDKAATKRVLLAAGVPTPGLVTLCETPWQLRDLGARMERVAGFVLKPARGSGGAGILVIVGREPPAFVKASGARLAWPELAAHAVDVLGGVFSPGSREDTLLVEDLVVPEPGLAALAYRGVPDLRILVFRGVPVLGMLRLPTRRSDGRANLHLGGVGVGVALGTGRTTRAVVGARPVTAHPDLGVPLIGNTVPAWREALELAVRAADAVGLGYVGVDLVFDARRGPLVLELNARPGLAIQLANGRGLRPLLERIAGESLPAGAAERAALGMRLAGDVAA